MKKFISNRFTALLGCTLLLAIVSQLNWHLYQLQAQEDFFFAEKPTEEDESHSFYSTPSTNDVHITTEWIAPPHHAENQLDSHQPSYHASETPYTGDIQITSEWIAPPHPIASDPESYQPSHQADAQITTEWIAPPHPIASDPESYQSSHQADAQITTEWIAPHHPITSEPESYQPSHQADAQITTEWIAPPHPIASELESYQPSPQADAQITTEWITPAQRDELKSSQTSYHASDAHHTDDVQITTEWVAPPHPIANELKSYQQSQQADAKITTEWITPAQRDELESHRPSHISHTQISADQHPQNHLNGSTIPHEEAPKQALSLKPKEEIKSAIPKDVQQDLSQGKANVVIVKKPKAVIQLNEWESEIDINGQETMDIAGVGVIEPEINPEMTTPKPKTKPKPGFKEDKEGIASTDQADAKALKQGSIKDLYKERGLISQIVAETSAAISQPTPSNEIAQLTKEDPKPSALSPVEENDQTIAQATPVPPRATRPATVTNPSTVTNEPVREISINFNNVAMVEYIRFISRISNKNFIFDEEDLQFNVTIVSEEPTSVDNLMAALLQELRIRDFLFIEQGNNIIIHRNPRVRAPATVVSENLREGAAGNEFVTRVFRLNTLDPLRASEVIRPLLSDDALVEVLRDSNNLIITDLVANVVKIAELVAALDAPNSGLTIGQYAVRNSFVDSLVTLAERILQPIAQGTPFVLVPHPASNSIFIVSNPFLVERALAILENLDSNEGRTKIFTLDRLRAREAEAAAAAQAQQAANAPGQAGTAIPEIPLPEGLPDIFSPQSAGLLPSGATDIFTEFAPGGLTSVPTYAYDLPIGNIARTLFFIYKLKYRRGDQIEIALRRIADALIATGTTNADLIAAINSIQWIEASNSLVFTGTAIALDKVKELIEEIDLPLRQVFIEMLILDTTISDSLRYGVEWGSRFGGGEVAGAEAFISGEQRLVGLENTATLTTVPNPVGIAVTEGFHAGIIGRHLTRDGTFFNTIAALVTAVHTDTKAKIVMNPKIITEDNHTAEIFVGSTTRYKTQSISNDQGTILTNNFQFLDVGTTLRVTPLIGSNDVITLDIIEEITNTTPTANTGNVSEADINLIPVLTKNRTVTKAHVPNGFFVVISGMIQDNNVRTMSRVPCLGGIPLIGAANKFRGNQDDKRNLMIFIRPVIVDSEEELEYLTKRQQDIYTEKGKYRRSWNYEIDEALDFINLKPTDPDEIGCTIR